MSYLILQFRINIYTANIRGPADLIIFVFYKLNLTARRSRILRSAVKEARSKIMQISRRAEKKHIMTHP